MIPINIKKIYPKVFVENNTEIFSKIILNRSVSFANNAITRLPEHRRMDDFPDLCSGKIISLCPRNGRDLLVLEEHTQLEVSVQYDNIFLTDFKKQELTMLIDGLYQINKSILKEIESYEEFIELMPLNGSILSLKEIRMEKIKEFVKNINSMKGLDESKIEQAIDKLLIITK